MVQGIQTKLEARPGTEDLRKDLLENARKGLQELLQEAQRQGNPDQTLVWTYFRMGDVDQVLGNTLAAKKEYASGSDIAVQTRGGRPEQFPSPKRPGHQLHQPRQYRAAVGPDAGGPRLLSESIGDPAASGGGRPQGCQGPTRPEHQLRTARRRDEAFGPDAEALDFYRKASAIRQRLADADTTNVQAQSDLSVACERLGDVTMQLGQTQEALDFYQKSKAIRAAAGGRRPQECPSPTQP